MQSRGRSSLITVRQVDTSTALQTRSPPPPHPPPVAEEAQSGAVEEEQRAEVYVTFTLRCSTSSPCAPAFGTRVGRSCNTPYPWSSHVTSPTRTPTWSRERHFPTPSTLMAVYAACSVTRASAQCPQVCTASTLTEDSINAEAPSKTGGLHALRSSPTCVYHMET